MNNPAYQEYLKDVLGDSTPAQKFCTQCGTGNDTKFRFCQSCGAAMGGETAPGLCGGCGTQNAPTSKFCGSCGSPLASAKEEEEAKGVKTRITSASGNQHEIRVWTEPVTGMKFVWIEGGSFQMGNLFGEGFDDEQSIREVTLSSFWLGQYEVTQGEWQKIMGNNPSDFK
ncbi:MAG: zinc ribbon domain-containing protein, partial [SAR324 cluster bacterium]|nr:zinc ribbon domain-containing protein [SAR324 cluster bacterium]